MDQKGSDTRQDLTSRDIVAQTGDLDEEDLADWAHLDLVLPLAVCGVRVDPFVEFDHVVAANLHENQDQTVFEKLQVEGVAET